MKKNYSYKKNKDLKNYLDLTFGNMPTYKYKTNDTFNHKETWSSFNLNKIVSEICSRLPNEELNNLPSIFCNIVGDYFKFKKKKISLLNSGGLTKSIFRHSDYKYVVTFNTETREHLLNIKELKKINKKMQRNNDFSKTTINKKEEKPKTKKEKKLSNGEVSLNRGEEHQLKLKVSKYGDSPISKPIKDFIECKEKENGLFLSPAPTGSGKSYNIAELIINHIVNNKEKKIFFITDRIENVDNPYKTIEKILEENKYGLTAKEKLYIKQKMTRVESNEDNVYKLKNEDFNAFFEDLKKLSLSENDKDNISKKQKEIINKKEELENFKRIIENNNNDKKTKELFQSGIDKVIKDIIEIISSLIKKIKNSILEEDLSFRSRAFLSKIFLADAIKWHTAVFMTTKKMLNIFRGAFEKTTEMQKIENAVIIFDEVDHQKLVFEEDFVDSESYKSSIQLQYIFNLLRHKPERDRCYKELEPLHFDLINELKNKKNVFCPEYNSVFIRIKNEDIADNYTANIFYDGSKNTVYGKKNLFLTRDFDTNKNLNIFKELPSNGKKQDRKAFDYIKEMENFIDYNFTSHIKKMVYKLLDIDAELKTVEDAVIKIFDWLGLKDESFYNSKSNRLINRVIKNINNKNKNKNKDEDITDISNYQDAVKIMNFRKFNDYHEFNVNTTKNNSHVYFMELCLKNKVIGLSATSLAKTNVGNFDLDFLSEKLGGDCETYTYQEILDIKNTLSYKYDYSDDNIYCKEIDENGEFEYLNEDLKELNENDLKRLRKLINAVEVFKEKENSKYMCAFFSKYFGEKYSQYLNSKFKGNILFISMNSEYIKKKDYKKAINTHLSKDKANKVVILTTYQTASSGLNLQRPLNKFDIKDESYLSLGGKEINYGKDEIDIDTIYFDRITALFSGMIIENESKSNISDKLRMMEHLKDLNATGVLNKKQYRGYLEDVSYSNSPYQTGSKIYDKTEDYNEYVIKIIRQTIGRSVRTNNRSTEINYLFDTEMINNLNESSLNGKIIETELETKEMANVIKFFNSRFKENEKPHYYSIEGSKKNNNSMLYIGNFLKVFNIENHPKKDVAIKRWEDDRLYLLENGIYFDSAKNNRFSKYLTSINNEYLKMDKPDFDNIEVKNFGKGREIDESYFNLDLIKNNIELEKFFISKNYCLSFNDEKNYFISPALFNNIYKAAIGEEIVRYYFERSSLDLEQLDKNRYEKCDFYLKGNPNIGLDAKNWIEESKRNDDETLTKISKKLKYFEKIIIINTFGSHGNMNFYDELKNKVETIEEAKIVVIPSCISNETGKENTELWKNIDKVRKWALEK